MLIFLNKYFACVLQKEQRHIISGQLDQKTQKQLGKQVKSLYFM